MKHADVHERLPRSRPSFASALSGLALAAALYIGSPAALLVVHFGINTALANTLVGLIASGSMWYISVFYPFLIPVIATVQGLIVAAGIGVAVAW